MESAEASKRVLRAIVEMFATGDISSVSEVVGEDYIDHQGAGSLSKEGVAGFVEVVKAARQSFMTLAVGLEDLVAENDLAVARVRWHGVLRNAEVVQRETIDMVRVKEGKAVEHWGGEAWVRQTPPQH
jgi:predicted SnoaL-like aldol condensation-catalyzing enzyme